MKLIILSLLVSTLSFASNELDARLSFKSIVGVVVNSQEEPVHSDQIESEIAAQLKDKLRFDFSESGYLALKESFKQTQITPIDALQNIRLDSMKPGLAAVSAIGVKAAVLSYLRKSSDGYQEFFYLVALPSNEIIHKVEVPVENPTVLSSFSDAAKKAMFELMKGLPFDATVVSRDGYRVILDRGADLLKPNQQISTYTIEQKDGNLVFEETGIIQVTQVEPNLAFGKVVVEKRPREVVTGNKIRLEATNANIVSTIQLLEESSAKRGLASLPPPMMTSDSSGGSASVMQTQADFEPQFEISKGKVGNVGMDLGASLVNFDTLTTYGTDDQGNPKRRDFQNNRIFPQTTIRGEIYLTSRVFFEGLYSYAMGNVDSYSGGADVHNASPTAYKSTSTSMTAMRLLLGYRVNIFAPNAGPIVYVKTGYARQAFSFNEDVKQTQFLSTTYGGLLLGGGVSIHPVDKMQTALEVNTNIFPGVQEEPITADTTQVSSGADYSNVSSWELAVKVGYEITKDMDFTVRGFLQSYGAEFSGTKKRTVKVDSISENIKGFQAGVSYFF